MSTSGLKSAFAISFIFFAGTTVFATSIEARIPFAFVVGEKVLPPADYIVETASGSDPGVLTIRTTTSADQVIFDTNQLPARDNPRAIELVFDKAGRQTYLVEVWGVTDSGRAVKLEPLSAAVRQRIAATRIVDGRTSARTEGSGGR